MGQRMQIYVRVENKTLGVHCQWLFGNKALRQLEELLVTAEDYKTANKLKKYDRRHTYNRLQEIFSGATLEDRVISDPRTTGDNDNGILVIDLNGDTPKYSFLSLWGLQCEMIDNLKIQHPEDPYTGQDYSYTNFTPISAKEWRQLHYGNNKVESTNFFKSIETLTSRELGEIFPDMVEDKRGTGITVQANTLLFMDIVEKKFAIKSTTKTNHKVSKKKRS